MTLLDAKEYQPEKERKRRAKIVSAIALVLILAAVAWWNRFWPEKHVADKFFSSLQKQDFETAYGIYYADPEWKQHPQKYSQYGFQDFMKDWGPGGEWGLIKSHRIYGSANTKGLGSGGVVVEVVVNERAEHARMFVQKSDKTLTVYPY